MRGADKRPKGEGSAVRLGEGENGPVEGDVK